MPNGIDKSKLEELDEMSKGQYFDRQGNEIKFSEWATNMELRENKVVKQESVGDYWVSTVWLGLDHGYGMGPPLIFETMVFDVSKPPIPALEDIKNPDVETPKVTRWTDLYCDRYSTEAEAIAGHDRVVRLLKKGELDLYEPQ